MTLFHRNSKNISKFLVGKDSNVFGEETLCVLRDWPGYTVVAALTMPF